MRGQFLISTWIAITALVACGTPVSKRVSAARPAPVSAPTSSAAGPAPTTVGSLTVFEQPVMDLPAGLPTDSAASIDEYNRRSKGLARRPDPTAEQQEQAAVLAKLGFRTKGTLRSAVVNERGDDFAAVVTNADASADVLVRKGSTSPWETNGSMRHGGAAPIFVGNDLVTVELVEKDTFVVVRREKDVVHRIVLPEPRQRFHVDQLTSWKDHWVLEFDGDVIVDGDSLKKRGGYREVFDWMLVGGEPLFFFVKDDGRTGIDHRGEVLPLAYDHVLHGACCEPGAYNPQPTSWGVRFHAKRGITWYYVELATK